MSRIKSAVPPVLREQYDGHGGTPDPRSEPPAEGAATPYSIPA